MKSLEEVMKEYKLSDEEHQKIGEEIKRIWFHDKFPVDNPKGIIDIAPPASGKTGLNGFGQEQFLDGNVVIINSDEFKPFHPKADEIAKLYPQYYTKVTDQESNTWTSDLFDEALRKGYNVIFEGTGKNTRILDTISSKMQKYNVVVRGMAVNELNCLRSLLERYEFQVKAKGWGRLVTLDHFYETYDAMPNTVDTIEKSGIVNSVEIYKRGKTPSNPIMIYNSVDKENGRFPNAKFAVLGGRIEDRKKANQNFKETEQELFQMMSGKELSEEEKSILKKMEELNKLYEQELCRE